MTYKEENKLFLIGKSANCNAQFCDNMQVHIPFKEILWKLLKTIFRECSE